MQGGSIDFILEFGRIGLEKKLYCNGMKSYMVVYICVLEFLLFYGGFLQLFGVLCVQIGCDFYVKMVLIL